MDDAPLPILRPRIFTSLMDWLDPKAPIEWLADFLKVIYDCRNLDWLLLTKRPQNWKPMLDAIYRFPSTSENIYIRNRCDMWLKGMAPPNVWFGVTVENQKAADERIPIMLNIPARVHWLSVEPILERVDLGLNHTQGPDRIGRENTNHVINWVVIGGESGPRFREAKGGTVKAIADVVEQCKAAGVPCFVKQDAARLPGKQGRLSGELWAMKQFPK